MNHIHKYKKTNISNKKNKKYFVWKCQLVDCTHYLTKQHVVGRKSICWVCGETCIVRKENDGSIRAKPHCPECIKVTKTKGVSEDMLDALGV